MKLGKCLPLQLTAAAYIHIFLEITIQLIYALYLFMVTSGETLQFFLQGQLTIVKLGKLAHSLGPVLAYFLNKTIAAYFKCNNHFTMLVFLPMMEPSKSFCSPDRGDSLPFPTCTAAPGSFASRSCRR